MRTGSHPNGVLGPLPKAPGGLARQFNPSQREPLALGGSGLTPRPPRFRACRQEDPGSSRPSSFRGSELTPMLQGSPSGSMWQRGDKGAGDPGRDLERDDAFRAPLTPG